MTIVEVLEPVRKNGTRVDQVLAVLFFTLRQGAHAHGMTVGEVRASLKAAKIPSWKGINIADALAKSGSFAHVISKDGRSNQWALTPSGSRHIAGVLGVSLSSEPAAKSGADMTHLRNQISDLDVRAYIDEAIRCHGASARRACIVFLWAGAIRAIHQKLLTLNNDALNQALKKHYPKAKDVTTIDHFAYIDDSLALKAVQELGLYDKSQKGTLEEALNLRNRCGHPGKYHPSEEKVQSFVADIVDLVFSAL